MVCEKPYVWLKTHVFWFVGLYFGLDLYQLDLSVQWRSQDFNVRRVRKVRQHVQAYLGYRRSNKSQTLKVNFFT
jgi:hypothetical protein